MKTTTQLKFFLKLLTVNLTPFFGRPNARKRGRPKTLKRRAPEKKIIWRPEKKRGRPKKKRAPSNEKEGALK